MTADGVRPSFAIPRPADPDVERRRRAADRCGEWRGREEAGDRAVAVDRHGLRPVDCQRTESGVRSRE
jgi:hypothetical protein